MTATRTAAPVLAETFARRDLRSRCLESTNQRLPYPGRPAPSWTRALQPTRGRTSTRFNRARPATLSGRVSSGLRAGSASNLERRSETEAERAPDGADAMTNVVRASRAPNVRTPIVRSLGIDTR